MKKLKFAVQVFTAISALPVLAVMELNHNAKSLAVEHKTTIQQTINIAEGYYFKTTGSKTAVYPKKTFTRLYCK